jgi:4-hydroxybenzoate polyprenyltransferase
MVKNYFSFIKFSHSIFALPFAAIGFFLAVLKENHPFSLRQFLLMLACMVTARSAAMAFNRFADADVDAANPRTAMREVPRGIISKNSALIFSIINSILFVTITYFVNKICFFLSPVALFILLGYSFTKRFTYLSHLVLGLALSLAPVGAYLVVAGKFSILPWLFALAVLCWVSGFDVIYALQDEKFDKENNLFSIPASWGFLKALHISEALHFFSFSFIVLTGILGGFGVLYWFGVLFFAAALIYQHRLVKPGDLSRVNMAFATTNGFASLIFAAFVIADFYFKH